MPLQASEVVYPIADPLDDRPGWQRPEVVEVSIAAVTQSILGTGGLDATFNFTKIS